MYETRGSVGVQEMSVRTRVAPPANVPLGRSFQIDPSALRDGIARSLAPSARIGCRQDPQIQALSMGDASLIHKLNAPYMLTYQELQKERYPMPVVTTHPNSIEIRSRVWMEHGLIMKVVTHGEGSNTLATVTISSHANPMQDVDTGEITTPPNLEFVDETYRSTDDGCYKRLYLNAYQTEQQYKYHPKSPAEAKKPYMSGAPYFSAIGMALEAMLDVASGSDTLMGIGALNSSQFTGDQAMERAGNVPMHSIIRFLITHYATAARAFNSTDHVNVLDRETRSYKPVRH